MASVCARARGCVFEAKRHTPSLSLALLPQRSCGGPAAAEGGVDVGAAAEKAGAEARVRRLQPQPRVRRRRAGGGGGLKCGRRATAERRARSARASFLLPHKVSHSRVFKMLIPTPGSRRRGSAQTRASRRTRSGTVADSEEERSALPTAGTWPAIEAGHRDSLLYSGGKNPRDSAATQASAHHHTHHIEADGTHTSKQDTAAQHTRTASHTTPSSPKLPGGSPAPQSVVALHSMRSGSKEAGSAAGP